MQMEGPRASSGDGGTGVVYVVDDDDELRRSLHFMLKTAHISVTPFASGTQFLRELDALQPAPIVLDIRMPAMGGTEVLAELAARQNKWPVIVLTGHGEIAVAVQSLKLGAVDFLEKPAIPTDLINSIYAAFERLAGQVETGVCRQQAAERIASLTPRQAEILHQLCRGRSTKQIAFDLSISPRTVEMHRASALRHLKVRTVTEAAVIRTAANS